jgi:hypothetical protein
VSEIKFLLIELHCGENISSTTSYKIDLKTPKYNFYIVGNEFTKHFFIYYLKQILKIYKEFDNTTKFFLKIIDNSCNTITLELTNNNESIILEKNKYEIKV